MHKRKKDQKRQFLIESNETQMKREKINNKTNFFRGIRSFFWIKKIFSKRLFFGFLGCCLFGAGGFAVFSSYFDIKSIEITQTSITLSEKEVYNVFEEFRGKNMLFFEQKDLEKALMDNFIGIKKVKVNEIWPNKQEIQVVAVDPVFKVIIGEKAWWLSEEGILLDPDRIFSEADLPTLHLIGYRTEELGELIHGVKFDPETVELIFETEKLIEEKNINISQIKWFFHAREAHFTIAPQETDLWVDLQQEVSTQLSKIQYADESQCSWRQLNLDYIDLRIPKKIYCR